MGDLGWVEAGPVIFTAVSLVQHDRRLTVAELLRDVDQGLLVGGDVDGRELDAGFGELLLGLVARETVRRFDVQRQSNENPPPR